MVRDTQDGDAAKTILQNALALHFMLAPRLESPSIAAIHQLLSALTDHDRITDAFLVYRDAEMRPAWAEAARPVATEAIYSVLASGLARIEDIRSITHLTSVATSRGVPMSQNFYTAVICGLTKPQQVVRNHSGKPARFVPLPNQGHPGPAYAKRVQIAETLFESMHRHRVSRPTKVHHALMYAWALLGQHKKVQSYFDKLKSECENDHSSNAAINEATWGILMYAYTRAHNTQGALNVFARAAEWLKSSQHTSQSPSTLRTSYLINMAMGCFLSNGDPRSALAFLDESIARYSAEQVAPASKSELPATPADPVTLNLIVRALLSDGQLAKALSVYESIRAEYNIAEAPSELSLFLRYCMRHGDVAGSFELAERIMRAGRVLSDRQWLELMHLCANECSPDVVIYLYEQLCLLTGTDGKNKVPALLKKYPDMVRWVCNALKQNKRDEDAAAIHSALAANPAPAVPKAEVPTPPPPCAKAQSLALYRQLLRAIHRFPISNLRDKLAYNARFAFELYRDLDSNDQRIRTLLSQGKEQALWLQSWRKDTETVQKLVGSSHGSKQEK
ncbi:hypothetical protein GGI12_004462 [Dipsacomyces acuminosporus]|nr:hypothetical protein GGI12_004462 [Dipsacomyces acuminosporus]